MPGDTGHISQPTAAGGGAGQEEVEGVSPELIKAIRAALEQGYRVELILDKEGNIKAQTVSRKILK